MDYSNIDEVAKAIMKYDCNLGMSFYNLPTEISNAFDTSSDLKESKYSDAKNKLNELALKGALETLFILKQNERDLACEKAEELFAKFQAVPGDDAVNGSAAFDLYSVAADSAIDLNTECEELENFITAQMFEQFAH